jgi:hypothetical protein
MLTRRALYAAAACASLVFAACGRQHEKVAASDVVDSRCVAAAAKFGENIVPIKSYSTTGQAYDDWRAARPGSPRPVSSSEFPAQYAPTDNLVVCYLQGDFGLVRNPPPLNGDAPSDLHYQEADYVVLPDGSLLPDRLGMTSNFPADEPTPSPG